MAKTKEEKLTSVNKTGRMYFSVADAIGTAGKALIQVGALLLLVGFGSAALAALQQHRAEKIKREIINEKRNR